MRTIALTLVACLLGTAAASGPDTLWVRTIDIGGDEHGNGIASRGNAIAVGGDSSYSGWLVALLKQNGDLLWTRTYTNGGGEQAIDVCLDGNSSVVVAGMGSTFEPARPLSRLRMSFVPGLNGPRTQTIQYALIAKYDSMGDRKWMRVDTNYVAVGVAADTAGNYYVSGAHVIGDFVWDFWLAKLDSAGDTVWSRTYDFSMVDIGYRIAVDASGNVAACAYSGDLSNMDCVTMKFAPNGDTIWTRRFDGGPDDACCGTAIDPSGNIIIAGRTELDSVYDGLLLKYDSTGVLVWSKVVDLKADDALMGAACDSAGDIFAAGYTGSGGTNRCVTMKLDSAGSMLWTAYYGESGDNGAYDVALDSIGNPIITGNVNPSGYDLLVAKYSALTGIAESHAAPSTPARAATTITAAPDFVLSVPSSGHYDIRLCDLTGRTRQQVFRGYLSEGAHRLSLSGQPAGSYFVRVAAPGGGVSCQRLVLVK
jgi:hypothetical protein